jgi:transcriptional regulator with XRE-family HTH domain
MRRDLLSHNIKAARTATHLTQEDAAFRAGMQTAVYSRIERGEVDPHLSTLVKIAEALALPVSELVDGLS